MPREPQIIRHPSQLRGLTTLPLLRTPGRGRVVIDDERLDEKQRTGWERRLNRLYFACGCDMAAIGVAAGVLGAIAWSLLRDGGWSTFRWRETGIALLIIIVAACAGKLLGLFRAQRTLRAVVDEIQAQWTVPAEDGTEIEFCG